MDRSLYTRPNKPKKVYFESKEGAPVLPVASNLPEILEVSGTSECHVTPPEIAALMADYLQIWEPFRVLEPSAGTGNLIQAIFNTDKRPVIEACEQSYDLVQSMHKRFENEDVRVWRDDFLDFAPNSHKFNRIVMNPPFRKIKQHMSAAINLLEAEDAILIALVPITYQHDEAETLETLSADTFASAKVNTKIIGIYR